MGDSTTDAAVAEPWWDHLVKNVLERIDTLSISEKLEQRVQEQDTKIEIVKMAFETMLKMQIEQMQATMNANMDEKVRVADVKLACLEMKLEACHAEITALQALQTETTTKITEMSKLKKRRFPFFFSAA